MNDRGIEAGRIMLRRKRKIWTQSREGEKECMMKKLKIRHPPVCEIWSSRTPKCILAEFRKRHRCCKTHIIEGSVLSLYLSTLSIHMFI